jgi:phosphoribosylglycinamide formyltransferase 1
MPEKRKLLIMLSGRGSNMEAILDSVLYGSLKPLAEVMCVFSNNQTALGLERADMKGVPTWLITSRSKKRTQYNQELKDWLEEINPDFIILAGYMLIIPAEIISLFPERIINIHPADTWQHQGLHGYEWAWQKRLTTTKITIHYVDRGLDTGSIIAQKEVNLKGANSLDEVEMLGLKVEHEFYSSVLEKLFKQ